MRSRSATLLCLALLVGVGTWTLSWIRGQDAQPPRPAAPVLRPAARPIVVAPPAAAPSAPRKPGRDLSKLRPLEKQMYYSARRAAGWLHQMNNLKGRFVPGVQPALNVPLDGDHALRQAGAAFALARAARYLDDESQSARARQAILALLEETVADGEKKVRHGVLPSGIINRLSHAALLVLAIHELPRPDEDLLARADQLCEYIRRQQRPDGSLRCRELVAGSKDEGDSLEEALLYPGQALLALMRSQERRPAAWKLDIVRKSLAPSLKRWREHREREFVAWHAAAWTEAYLATKEKGFADAVFEMADWLCGLQHERLDPQHPQWMGGFHNILDGKVVSLVPDVTSAVCAEGLAEACRLTRQLGDLQRHERYQGTLERALQFLTTLQYSEADTQHFADWYRPSLVGGFHLSHQDGNLRIEYTQHGLNALVQYLRHVAQIQ